MLCGQSHLQRRFGNRYFRMSRGLLYIALAVVAGIAVLAEGPASYPGQITYPPPLQPPTAPVSTLGPYVHQYAGYYDDLPSYGVQTGYEGFLVPTKNEEEEDEDNFSLLSLLSPQYFWLLPALSRLASPLRLIAKLGFLLLGPLTLVILGGLLTAGVCIFTPICTLTILGFGLKRENVRALLAPDRLASLSTFVSKAIEKYQAMQKKKFPKKVYMLPKDKENEVTASVVNSTEGASSKDA